MEDQAHYEKYLFESFMQHYNNTSNYIENNLLYAIINNEEFFFQIVAILKNDLHCYNFFYFSLASIGEKNFNNFLTLSYLAVLFSNISFGDILSHVNNTENDALDKKTKFIKI